jgi:hypothetical protein
MGRHSIDYGIFFTIIESVLGGLKMADPVLIWIHLNIVWHPPDSQTEGKGNCRNMLE